MALLAAAAASLLLGTASCRSDLGETRSVLLITLDTTRYDALSCFGAEAESSPNLDALAAEGICYDAARTVAPLTLPSHASMLTGLVPPRHTVRVNGRNPLPDSATTLAEKARRHGVETAAFVSAAVLADEFGLGQGFDEYRQPEVTGVVNQASYARRPASEMADQVVAWVEQRDPERPFFLWTHFFDPHLPYGAPEDLASRFEHLGVRGEYLAEVANADRAIGRILEALRAAGVYDETLVVVVADHGEAQGENGEPTHGTLAYDSTMRVPMILRYPDGARGGRRSSEIVSVVDVFPTVVEALGLGSAGDVDGISLFHRAAPADRGVYLEASYGWYSFGWSPLLGWVDREGKYLHSAEPELYAPGVESDSADRIDAQPEVALRYVDRLRAVLDRPALEHSDEGGADPLWISALEKLGYAGAPGAEAMADPLDGAGRPSPRSRRAAYRTFLRAEELLGLGRAADSVPLYRQILQENDGNHTAWFELGGALLQLERWEESLEASGRAIEVGRDWYGPHLNLAIALDRIGRTDEAIEHYAIALSEQPSMGNHLARLIRLCEEAGRADEANRYRLLGLEAQEAARTR